MPAFHPAPGARAWDVINRAEAMQRSGAMLLIDEDETDIVITQWNFAARIGTEFASHSRYLDPNDKNRRLTGCREQGHVYVDSYIGPICARCCRPRNGRGSGAT